MTALTVSASPDALASGDIAAVIASLPLSLRDGESGQPADLVAIDGSPDWPKRTAEALLRDARGLLIIHPTPVPPHEVPDASALPVIVDYRFAGNPALTAAADAFAGWPTDAMIDVAAVVPDAAELNATLVDQLATLRRVGHPAAGLTRLTWDDSGYYLQGATAEGIPLLLNAHVTTGARASLRVRGLAREVAVELTLPDPGTARPAVLVSTTPAGATTTPTLWETSHRAAWRRLHAAATDAAPANDLVDLRSDLTAAQQVSRS